MKVVNNISEFTASKQSVITIGTFDGVHIGHRKIITDLVSIAKKNNLQSIILTFFPHPRTVLQKDSNMKMIDTLDEKKKIFEKLGLEILIIQEFSVEFSRLTAIEFVRDILVNKLNISRLIIGYDHRFGRNRESNVEDLKSFGVDFNSKVDQISSQNIESIAVSSTKIRNAITQGKIKLANKFLTRNFKMNGIVIEGNKLGRKIGFPTANLKIINNYKIRPKNGVYLVKSKFSEKILFGMMNVGFRPTILGKNIQIEIHFFSFNENLYGMSLSIELLEKIREEKKFDSLDKLKNQLNKDSKKCQKLILQYIQH